MTIKEFKTEEQKRADRKAMLQAQSDYDKKAFVLAALLLLIFLGVSYYFTSSSKLIELMERIRLRMALENKELKARHITLNMKKEVLRKKLEDLNSRVSLQLATDEDTKLNEEQYEQLLQQQIDEEEENEDDDE